MTSSQPPAWAQAVLSLFLPARGRNGVLGDLLEEYREAQLPARGAPGANMWYLRQAFGFIMRGSLPWALLACAIFIGRDILDLTLPTNDFHMRAVVTTYASISAFAMGGFVTAWRSRRAWSGTALGAIAAVITAVIATVYALTAGQLLLNAAFAANPRAYAALVRAADVPVVPIIIVGVLAGSIGGGIGRVCRGVVVPLKGRVS
jgi:hypothetical protein